jgi:hypothetical protein
MLRWPLSDRKCRVPDDLGKRGPPDRNRINVNEPWELNWWAKELGVSPAQVIAAVRAVGRWPPTFGAN